MRKRFTGLLSEGNVSVGGTWINTGTVLLQSGDVEVSPGGLLRDEDAERTSITGTLINHGAVEAGGYFMTADQVDNYGDVSATLALATDEYRQFGGTTRVQGAGTLGADRGIEIHAGSVEGDGRIGGHVTVYGGQLVTDAGALYIDGNLDLRAEATFVATIGAGVSRVDVAGTMLRGGTLQIAFADGLAVTAGDQWIVATAASFQGAFADVVWPSLPGIGFEAFVDPGLFPNALVVQAVRAVPLPAPVFLLAGVCAFLPRLRRRQ